jgi:putative ABC transport system permease protein
MIAALQRLAPSIRAIMRRPGLALTRLLTVSLVITALAAVAALASASLFRRLPFPDADRLVQIYLLPPDTTDVTNSTALFPVVFEHLDARGPSFEAVAGIWVADRAVAGRGDPESISAGRVSANFFAMLGADLAIGRTFTEEDVKVDAPLVVLSHGLWTRMFGADPAVIGTVLQIDRRPHTVIGVASRDFDPAFTATQFWTPLRWSDSAALRATVVQTIGRLRPGATRATAIADLQPVLAAARQTLPDLLKSSTIAALDLRESRFGSRRNALVMLVVIVVALALIATANLANLTFADLSSRLGDIALRSALGGSARAIVIDEVLPCGIIAIAGSALGLWAAATAAPWMLSLDPALSQAGLSIEIDWRVALAGVAGAMTVMTTAVAIPSWRVARRDHVAFFSGTRLTDRRGRRRQSVLVAAQTAIALALMSAAALVVTTLQRNAAIDPGFDPSHVVTGQLRLAENAFPNHAARSRFIANVLERLSTTPGVAGAGTTLNPFIAGASFTTNVTVENAPRSDGQPYDLQFRRVSPGYFEAMHIRVIDGRSFQPTDTEARPPVAVVSESFARKFWPHGGAIGKRIRRGAATLPWAEIVGVVADVRDAGLIRETGPVMYTCYYQGSTAATAAGLVVRTAGDPRGAVPQIKRAIWAIDPAQPLSNIVLLDDYLASSLGPQQFRSWLVASCALSGILLAVIGIYGVTSRSVTERTKEVGIRIALGARPSNVWVRLVNSSLVAVIAGVGLGALLSVALDTGLVKLLPELGRSEWVFRVGSAVLVIAISTVATIVAARHAATIDPIRALRGD